MPLTEEEKSVMSESEIAQYEEAEASKVKTDEDVDAAAEALRIAQEEAEKEKKGLSKEEADAMVSRAVEAALAAREAAEAQAKAQETAKTKGRLTDAQRAELEQLANSDWAAYNERLLEIAEENAASRMRAESEERNRRLDEREVRETLSQGLGAKGQEYLAQYSPMISPENARDPKIQDLMRRAARDFERENTVVKSRTEKTYGDAPVVSEEERRTADMFARIAAEASGQDYEKVRLKDEQLRAIAQEEA